MRVRFRVIGASVALLAAVSTVSACTGSSKPAPHTSADPTPTMTQPSTTTTHSSSPSPTRTGPLTTGPNVRPGEKPPVLTAAAKQHNSAGAIAFAFYFFHALDWSFATNDPTLLEDVSQKSCVGCRELVRGIQSTTASGKKIIGGRISVSSAQLDPDQYRLKADYVVDVTYYQARASTRASDGSVSPVPSTGATARAALFIDWIRDHWSATHLTSPAEGQK